MDPLTEKQQVDAAIALHKSIYAAARQGDAQLRKITSDPVTVQVIKAAIATFIPKFPMCVTLRKKSHLNIAEIPIAYSICCAKNPVVNGQPADRALIVASRKMTNAMHFMFIHSTKMEYAKGFCGSFLVYRVQLDKVIVPTEMAVVRETVAEIDALCTQFNEMTHEYDDTKYKKEQARIDRKREALKEKFGEDGMEMLAARCSMNVD